MTQTIIKENTAELFAIKKQKNPTIKIHFRLVGVPPDIGFKTLDIPTTATIAEIKQILFQAYQVEKYHMTARQIQLMWKSKIIPDNMKLAQLKIDPKKTVFTLFANHKIGFGGG